VEPIRRPVIDDEHAGPGGAGFHLASQHSPSRTTGGGRVGTRGLDLDYGSG
jgi:hypothetical protein